MSYLLNIFIIIKLTNKNHKLLKHGKDKRIFHNIYHIKNQRIYLLSYAKNQKIDNKLFSLF